MTHFFAVWVTAAILWRFARPRFRRYAVTAVLLSLAAFATYWAYPAQPPWLAGEGVRMASVDRIVPIVWGQLGVPTAQSIYENGDFVNPVAAMPSLHAAFPLMLLLFFWSAGRWVRLALGAYTLAMAFTLVYGGEHFVADIVAGLGDGARRPRPGGRGSPPSASAVQRPTVNDCLQVGGRAVARVDVDPARLDDELPAVVVEAEVALVEGEADRLLLARVRASPAGSRAGGGPAARCSRRGRGCRAGPRRRPCGRRCW